jgi:hypothetical protein
MKKRISLFKEMSFERIKKLTKIQKTSLALVLLVVIGGISVLVYADEGHETAEPVVQQTEQVIVRKVGDVDIDAISQEGLSSFYGEITSKDVASINASREGVISSWNVSVGDNVLAGKVLGYITVTGVSAEQQQQLAAAESESLKARLDAELARQIASDSMNVFSGMSEKYKSILDLQNKAYGAVNGSSIAQQEVANLARLAFSDIYPHIGIPSRSTAEGGNLSANGTSLFDTLTYLGIKYGVGIKKSSVQYDYQSFIATYTKKIREGNVNVTDVQQFLNKTSNILSESFPQSDVFTQTDIDKVYEFVKDYQEKIASTSERYRDQALAGVDIQKNIIDFDNEIALKNLDQKSTQARAQNGALAAELLAQKLAVSAGGVIPILAAKSGIVATVEKNVGDYVTVSDRVGFISSANPRKNVRFTIPASWKDISKGDTLSISWRPEYSMGSAVITGISPIIDEKGGYQAEAIISKETAYPVGA